IVEGLGTVLIAVMAVVVTGRAGGIAEAIPVLGALALGAQRLLPMVQQVYTGWANAMGNRQSLQDIVDLLRRPRPLAPAVRSPLPFGDRIVLDSIGFSYDTGRTRTLAGISLEIPKGSRVGIAGKTGSGKSTLMDLLIGLLQPTEGEIRIDGVKLTEENRAA